MSESGSTALCGYKLVVVGCVTWALSCSGQQGSALSPGGTIVPTETNGNGNQTDDFAPDVAVYVTPDGALAGHIDLWVPPGRAGMQPHLALDYNSRSALSTVGYGWHLSGIPVITRCRRSAADSASGVPSAIHFDGRDQLCLDGEPLVPEAERATNDTMGTAYRTLNDRHARYVVTKIDGGGPAEITAYQSDGRILTFGWPIQLTQTRSTSDPSAQSVYVPSCGSVTFGWGLSSIRDHSGNEVVIEWDVVNDGASCPPRFPSEYYPTVIAYANNRKNHLLPTKQVRLRYNRQEDYNFPADVPRWISGVALTHDRRLAEIDEYGPSPSGTGSNFPVKTYLLAYTEGSAQLLAQHPELARTTLSSLTECDGAGVCKPPVLFQYDDTGPDQFTQKIDIGVSDVDTRDVGVMMGRPAYNPRLYSGDFNHDGKDDLVYLSTTPSASNTQHYMALFASGTPNAPTLGPAGADTTLSSIDCTYHPNPNTTVSAPCQPTQISAFDTGGRGYRDSLLLQPYPVVVTSVGWEPEVITLSDSQMQIQLRHYDSKAQAFVPVASTLWAPQTPDGFHVVVADLDGDGISELLGCNSWNGATEPFSNPCYWRLWRQNGVWSYSSPVATPLATVGAGLFLIDVDGDGSQEVMHAMDPGDHWITYHQTHVDVANPSATQTTSSALLGASPNLLVPLGSAYVSVAYQFLDFNGDGLTDGVELAADTSGTLYALVQFNTGAGFTRLQTYRVEGYSFNPADCAGANCLVSFRAIDFNHDGRQDLLFHNPDSEHYWIAWLDSSSSGTGLVVRASALDFAAPDSNYFNDQLTILDVNGDGVDDVAIPRSDLSVDGGPVEGDGSHVDLFVRPRINVENRLLKHVIRSGVPRNGSYAPGERISVSYAPITDPTVYRDDDAACRALSYPATCTRSKLWVVSQLRRSNEAVSDSVRVSSNATNYQYRDSRTDLRGRGFLGFGTVIETDLKTGNETTTHYDLSANGIRPSSYPLVGLPISTTTTRNYVNTVGASIARSDITTNIYQVTFTAGVARFAYASSTTKTIRERFRGPKGAPHVLKQDLIQTSMDKYGTLFQRSVSRIVGGVGADTVTHQPVYLDDGVTWPQIQSDTVTETSSGESAAGSLERTHVLNYDSAWLLTSDARLDGASDLGDPPLTVIIEHTAEGLPSRITQSESAARGGASRQVSYTYDGIERAFLASATNSLGQTTTFEYDLAFGLLGWQVDPNGVLSRQQYDRFGRLRLSAMLGYGRITHSYCPSNAIQPDALLLSDTIQRVLTIENDNGARSITEFNWIAKPRRKTWFNRPDGQGIEEVYAYNAYDGQLLQTFGPQFSSLPAPKFSKAKQTFAYDNLGRLTVARTVDGATWSRAYRGLTITTTNDDDHVSSTNVFDSQGHVVQNIETHQAADGTQSPTSTYYSYGPYGRLFQKIDAQGNVTRFETNRIGRIYHELDPDSGERYFRYNAFGQLETKQTPEYTTTYAYDQVGRELNDTTGARVNSFTWDVSPNGIGRLASMTSSDDVTTSFSYDWLGRLVQKTQTISGESFSMGYNYDDYGHLTKLTYPTIPNQQTPFTALYTYGAFGHLATVSDAGDPSTVFWSWVGADPTGAFETVALGSHLTEIETPSSARPGRLGEQKVVDSNNAARYDVTYEYDGRGNVTRKNDLVESSYQTYAYDPMSRLRGWNWYGGSANSHGIYDYDEIGNLIHDQHTAPASADVTYTYDRTKHGPHQYLDSVGYGPAGYDGNGRQTWMNASAITYDEHDHPIQSGIWSFPVNFEYDAQAQRVRREYVTCCVELTMDELYQRFTATSAGMASYHTMTVRAEGKPVALIKYDFQGLAPRSITYLTSDRLGSVVLRSNADGSDRERVEYSPFGEIMGVKSPGSNNTSADIGPAMYIGAEGDFGLYFYNLRGREYFPQMARFHTPDPLVGSSSSGQSWNPYSYARNNPVTWADPSGLEDDGLPTPGSPTFGQDFNAQLWADTIDMLGNGNSPEQASQATPQDSVTVSAVAGATDTIGGAGGEPKKPSGSFTLSVGGYLGLGGKIVIQYDAEHGKGAITVAGGVGEGVELDVSREARIPSRGSGSFFELAADASVVAGGVPLIVGDVALVNQNDPSDDASHAEANLMVTPLLGFEADSKKGGGLTIGGAVYMFADDLALDKALEKYVRDESRLNGLKAWEGHFHGHTVTIGLDAHGIGGYTFVFGRDPAPDPASIAQTKKLLEVHFPYPAGANPY